MRAAQSAEASGGFLKLLTNKKEKQHAPVHLSKSSAQTNSQPKRSTPRAPRSTVMSQMEGRAKVVADKNPADDLARRVVVPPR